MDERLSSGQTGTRRLLLVVGSAAAGVHAGLAPTHLHEWPPLGASFIAAAVVTGASVVAVALRPTDLWPVRVLALDLGGLAVAYLLTRLVALPPLDPEQEPFDAIGLLTLAAEGAGIVAALRLYRRPSIATGRALAALTQGGSQ